MNESLSKKLWRAGENSQTGCLVREIERLAADCGLTLSRWQTNAKDSGFVARITWTLHTGPRAQYACRQTNVEYVFCLRNAEGKTDKCRAFKELDEMREFLCAYKAITKIVG